MVDLGGRSAENLQKIRKHQPLIHNLTNFVVMNYTANVLLAIGASPVMAHAENEVEEMVTFAGALVLNIGTLSDSWVESMVLAGRKATALGKAIVLDPEASVLLGREIRTTTQISDAARQLARLGCAAVVIKGGHLQSGACDDYLYLAERQEAIILPGKRIATVNNHGTGCTLSAAIAANLAQGHSIEEAVRRAKEYITAAIAAGAAYTIGRGHGPVHHFHSFW